MKKLISCLLLLAVAFFPAAAQTKVWVGPKGSDANPGTLKRPLLHIQQAVELAAGKTGAVEICLLPGNYQVSRSIEIKQGRWSSLVIRGSALQQVSVSGDRDIPLRAARPVTDPQLRQRLQPRVADSIRVINFSELGISLSNLHPTGFGRPSLPAWNELMVDDTALQLSRWPNDSMALIGKVEVAGDATDRDQGRLPVFHYAESRPAAWRPDGNAWISGYFSWGYADDMIPLAGIDTTAKTIQAALFTTYQFRTGADFRRWFAVNLLEEIDRPGEYIIDSIHQRICFYPPHPEIRKLRLSVLQQPVFSITDCARVQLKNLLIENSRGMGVYMQHTQQVVVDSCIFRNLGNVAVSIGLGTLRNHPDSKTHSMEAGGRPVPGIIGDLAGRIYADPLFNRDAGQDNAVRNSYIYEVGAGGVSLGGGSRVTLEASGNFVENCIIRRYNRIEKSYRPAVWMDGAGCRVSKCDISDAPSMAILFHGNNHLIEYCKITHVCMEVDDQGAIYYGRDPSERGQVIRYNYFKDLSPHHRVTATYHDDGACGSDVYGNIYFRAGSLPVLIGGGSDHHYHNNIFMESPVAIHLDNRLQNWAAGMLDSTGIFRQRLAAVGYDRPPYSLAYPHLATYFRDNPALPQRNRIDGNLFYRIGNMVHGQTQWGNFWNNWITHDDPGFRDPADPLKGFRPDAALYQKIRDFVPIPVEQIGSSLPPLSW